jgi:spore photoproduct lyase
LHEINMQWHPKAEQMYLWRHWDDEGDKSYNRFYHEVIQQRKLSQNGMVNLRYKNNIKQKAISELQQLFEKHLPYCKIRYAF